MARRGTTSSSTVKQTQRQYQQQQRQAERLARQNYQDQRQADVDKRNRQIEKYFDHLTTLLQIALRTRIDAAKVIRSAGPPVIPAHPGDPPVPPDRAAFETALPKANVLESVFGVGKSKRLEAVEQAEAEFAEKERAYREAQQAYEEKLKTRNAAVEAFGQALAAGEPAAVANFASLVLEQSKYPDGFPKERKLAFNRASGELIVECDLPRFADIMPPVKGYKYIKTRDEVQELALNKSDERRLKDLYEQVIAAVALRSMHEIFASDRSKAVQSIVFNGMVDTVDLATGQDIRPCLVSVQATREDFTQLDLQRVDVKACLKHLRAQTSPAPTELIPIKPVVELVTTDARFIDGKDILSGLDSRINLLEMDPFEFEHLISNLFEQIGLKTSTTRASRDGGVDVIAFDERPIFGGKIVIQAKRYRRTVEVAAVRDLFGAVHNEGAVKGILVTTSSFGAESRKFAKDKPLELIDGNGLLHLLKEHGFDAKIELGG